MSSFAPEAVEAGARLDVPMARQALEATVERYQRMTPILRKQTQI
jgi:hypothetical protein